MADYFPGVAERSGPVRPAPIALWANGAVVVPRRTDHDSRGETPCRFRLFDVVPAEQRVKALRSWHTFRYDPRTGCRWGGIPHPLVRAGGEYLWLNVYTQEVRELVDPLGPWFAIDQEDDDEGQEGAATPGHAPWPWLTRRLGLVR